MFRSNDGAIDEITNTLDNTEYAGGASESNEAYVPLEADTCDAKKKKKKKAPKMNKRKRKERKLLHTPNWHWKRCKLADRLSELPNDILVSILSCLTLKEAARTSVLSRRWKNLWTCTTGTLDFHYSHRRMSSVLLLTYGLFGHCRERSPPVERIRFVACVNHVLTLHQGQTVDKFEISCKLYRRIRKTIINEWVEFALRKRVKRLRLDFTGKVSYSRGDYSLKKSFLCKNSLDSLTVLDLKNVDVTGKSISYILVKCQFLEGLFVEKSSTLVKLRVPGPLPQLKALEIKKCARLKYLEICAVNLKSFGYHGSFIPVIFDKVPHLVEASYGGYYASFVLANMRQKFSSSLTCLQSLVLEISGYDTYGIDRVLPEFPVLKNLRQLDLGLYDFDIDSIINCCASVLRCPMLERLSLKVDAYSVDDDPRPERNEKYLHNCLRALEFAGFDGNTEEAEIARFMVSCLPSLQQMTIRLPDFDGACLGYVERIKKSVTKFAKQLLEIMPPTAKLIVSP